MIATEVYYTDGCCNDRVCIQSEGFLTEDQFFDDAMLTDFDMDSPFVRI